MKSEDIRSHVRTLLTQEKDVYGDRARSAEFLGNCTTNVEAFNALYSVCGYPDIYAIEDGVVEIAGRSIGKILATRDSSTDPKFHRKLDPGYLNDFHPAALRAAIELFDEWQREQIYKYTLENPSCSEALAAFSRGAIVEDCFRQYFQDSYRAMVMASKAVVLFRLPTESELNLISAFTNTAMSIIAAESNVQILSHCISIVKAPLPKLDPLSGFEKCAHFQIKALAEVGCSYFKGAQRWYDALLPMATEENEHYIEILELLVKGNFKEADRKSQEVKAHLLGADISMEESKFYFCWYVVVRWLINGTSFQKNIN